MSRRATTLLADYVRSIIYIAVTLSTISQLQKYNIHHSQQASIEHIYTPPEATDIIDEHLNLET